MEQILSESCLCQTLLVDKKAVDCCPVQLSIHYNHCNYTFKWAQAKRPDGSSSKLI